MNKTVFALPVSVEQIAAVIKQMGPDDRQRLLDLVPELREAAAEPASRTEEEARKVIEELRQEVLEALEGKPLSPSEPFLGDLTLEQYLELSDEERTRLWEQWAERSIEDFEELDVRSDAMPAR